MIKRELLLRTEIRTIYSSERQERMKLYFQLNEDFKQCMQPCGPMYGDAQVECQHACESIFDQYVEKLKGRYEVRPERFAMEVKDSDTFRSRKRQDRDNWFFKIFDVNFHDLIGIDKTPTVRQEPWTVDT